MVQLTAVRLQRFSELLCSKLSQQQCFLVMVVQLLVKQLVDQSWLPRLPTITVTDNTISVTDATVTEIADDSVQGVDAQFLQCQMARQSHLFCLHGSSYQAVQMYIML